MERLIPTLSMQVTYQCNIECKHCGPYCSPHESDWMTLDEMKDLIQQAGELGTYNVVFTGGEPTLLRKKLNTLLRFIRDETPIASTRMVTNGKWAKTYDTAYRKLKEWKAAGLVELNVSCGEFHQEFVPVDRVVNAYCAARDLDYTTVLLGGVFKKEGKSKYPPEVYKKAIRVATGEEPLPLELMSPYVSKCHGMVTGTAMDYGRGAKYIQKEDMILQSEDEIPSMCSDVLTAITVHPNGNTTACCGIMVRQESLLNIGDWRIERLRPMLEKAHQDVILNWIRYLGLKDMKRWLRAKDPDLQFRNEYACICDLCAEIVYNRRCQELLIEHGHERADDIVINKIAHDVTTHNENFKYAVTHIPADIPRS